MIQSVLDHSQLLFCDRVNLAALLDVLVQQAVEIFVAAALSTSIRISEVGLNLRRWINLLVVCKILPLFTVKVFTREPEGFSLSSIAWLTLSALLLRILCTTWHTRS